MAVYVKRNRFPQATLLYSELDYIQSTGTQYIDTGFKPNQDTKIVLDVEASKTNTAATMFYGAHESSSKIWMFGKGSGGNWTMTCHYGAQSQNIGTWDLSTFNVRRVITQDKNSFSIDGATYKFTYANFEMKYNMYLFGDNYQGKLWNPCPMKLYSCKIYDLGTLIRNYVPAMSLTGEIGLWDKVGKTFYGDASGNGFVAGKVAA